jgi:hypothetical protein
MSVLARTAVSARTAARIVAVAVVLAGLGACRPDVVSIESVPTSKFSRDLAWCNAQNTDVFGLGDSVKRCMKAKGYRFLRQY